MATTTASEVEAALGYAERGWHVFPCHTRSADGGCACGDPVCSSPAKHPLTAHGCKDATTDTEKIRRWSKMWPDCNWAIATGRVSGIVVLDADFAKGGEDSLEEIGDLPDTVTAHTGGGGRHLLFAHPGGPDIPNRAGVLPGIDVRGDGGYIIAPPSRHISGNEYVWELEAEPGDIPLAKWPKKLQSLCNKAAHTAGGGTASTDGKLPLAAWSDEGAVESGRRNDHLARLGGAMRRTGASRDVILAAISAENASRCEPPLPASEVEKIATSVARYAPHRVQVEAAPTSVEASDGDHWDLVVDLTEAYLRQNRPLWHRDGRTIHFAGVGRELQCSDLWQLPGQGDAVERIRNLLSRRRRMTLMAGLSALKQACRIASLRLLTDLPDVTGTDDPDQIEELRQQLAGFLTHERRHIHVERGWVINNYLHWAEHVPAGKGWMQCFTRRIFARIDKPGDPPRIAIQIGTLADDLKAKSAMKLREQMQHAKLLGDRSSIRVSGRVVSAYEISSNLVAEEAATPEVVPNEVTDDNRDDR